jgi:hypothetical protein
MPKCAGKADSPPCWDARRGILLNGFCILNRDTSVIELKNAIDKVLEDLTIAYYSF